jgi:alkanesulfonate monooxygenase SsuD/methylene tetrahydromethanopterin reductase-like flavin-dependent oxidoreductase (luciferase family)
VELGLMLGERPASVPASEHFDDVLRQVEAAQRNAFTCIVLGHHFVVPGARWLQPVPLLARLAAEVDPHVRLVPWVLVSPVYPPVLLAEELATLDIVTEGRLAVGLGIGYRTAEYEALGVPYEERNARFTEGIELLKELWTRDRVTFEGRFTTLRDVEVGIRPLQQPHPPIWIGAQTPNGLRRAARLGDALALSPVGAVDDLRERLALYTAERQALGKPVGRQPYRHEIVLAESREAAREEALRRTEAHYGRVGAGSPGRPRYADRTSGFALGTADECAAQLRAIAAELPVGPIIPRAFWPSMTVEDAVAYIDRLGRELLPLLST